MIYILIAFVFQTNSSNGMGGASAASVHPIEFESKAACLAAANELTRQAKADDHTRAYVLCAAKGAK